MEPRDCRAVPQDAPLPSEAGGQLSLRGVSQELAARGYLRAWEALRHKAGGEHVELKPACLERIPRGENHLECEVRHHEGPLGK